MNFEIDGEHKTVVAIEYLFSALLSESAHHLFTDESEAFQAANGSFEDADSRKRINDWYEFKNKKRTESKRTEKT